MSDSGPAAAAATTGFESFFASTTPGLVRLAVALTGSGAEAEELVQEAMIRCYVRWSRVGALDAPEAWCRRVLLNLIFSRTRRSRRDRRLAEIRVIEIDEPSASDRAVAASNFWSIVRTLPPRQAEVIALRYLDGLDVAGIATALGRAEGTVRAQLHTARTALRSRLDENGELR